MEIRPLSIHWLFEPDSHFALNNVLYECYSLNMSFAYDGVYRTLVIIWNYIIPINVPNDDHRQSNM